MEKIEELFELLEKKYQFDKKNKLLISLLEILLALVTGTLFKMMFDSPETYKIIIFIVICIIYFILVFRRLIREKDFSVSGLGELKSTLKLQISEKNIERKKATYEYIELAIASLNDQTCTYSGSTLDDEHLCSNGIESGIRSVFKSLIENTSNLLDTDKGKFSIAINLKHVPELPSKNIRNATGSDSRSFVMKDDLSIIPNFPHDVLMDRTLVGLPFKISQQLIDTDRHNNFINSVINDNLKEYTVISTPIPEICEGGNNCTGSIFVISEKLEVIPSELEDYLKILGRLFSNWFTKYKDCINRRNEQSLNNAAKSKLALNILQKPIPTPTPTEVKNI